MQWNLKDMYLWFTEIAHMINLGLIICQKIERETGTDFGYKFVYDFYKKN